jgi:hypothetical protein
MPGRIQNITRTSLWNAWKAIRKELRRASCRDVVDFLEYDIDPDVWINRLLRQISQAQYEPSTPARFTLGKSLGFSRTMTFPAVPDLVLYRAIVDLVYRRAHGRERRHVYFRRDVLQQVQRRAADEAVETMKEVAGDYRRIEEKRFLTWLRYDQYRKLLIARKIHPYFVLTDVTNFFDSVLHSHVAEALRGLRLPPRMVGLLFFLLERLSIRQDYTDSHRISLPVDEFECSRTLAHIVLFEHDRTMVNLVGEDDYVRWMDDQSIGVESRARGLRVLAEVGKSLARHHLTANAKKSRILTLAEARRHFHLDLNEQLDEGHARAKRLPKGRSTFARLVRSIWHKARPLEGVGEFDKILSRLYRLAGRASLNLFHARALNDLLSKPELAERVCDYMRCTTSPSSYLDFVEGAMSSPEHIYPDVSVILTESLLRVETRGTTAGRIRGIALALLKDSLVIPGGSDCKAIAPLIILRFGTRRSLPALLKCVEDDSGRNTSSVVRASAIAYASWGTLEYRAIRKAASKLLKSPLPEAIRMVERIRKYDTVPVRYKGRLSSRVDSVSGRSYMDMRGVLTARLLALSSHPAVVRWVRDWKAQVAASDISAFDKNMLSRLLP